MKDIVFLLLFLPFIFLAFRNPFLGLCAWIWTIMAIPKNMLWGFSADIRFTYILALVTIISIVINTDPFSKKIKSGLFTLLVIFLIHTSISNVFTLASSSTSWAVWTDFFKAVLFSGLIIKLLTTQNRIETFIKVLLVGIGFNIFFEGLKFIVTLGSYKIIGINNSMMTDNNLFAMVILMVIPLFQYIIPTLKQKYLKLGFTGLAGLSAICVIGSFSRGGFVGLLIVGWELLKKSKNKILFIIIAILFSATAIYVASDKWTDRVQTIENADEDESFLGRVTAWKLASVAAIDNPIFGTGQDSMQHTLIWEYYYDDIYKMDFIDTRNVSPNKGKAAHSIYFQVLGDAGFLGLILFLSILFSAYFKSKRLAKHSELEWIKNLSKALNISLLIYMLTGALLSMAYYDLYYVLIALIISLEVIDKDSKKLNKTI